MQAKLDAAEKRVAELTAFIRDRVADRKTMCVKRGGGYHAKRICLEAESLLRKLDQ